MAEILGTPCAKAKAACKPFDMDKAHAKARVVKGAKGNLTVTSKGK